MITTRHNKQRQMEFSIEKILKESSDYHNILTPLILCEEIITQLSPLQGNVLCVANLEFLYVSIKHNISRERLFFVTPCPIKADFAEKVFALPKENIFRYETDTLKDIKMKFDIIIGNPPWNANRTAKNSDIYDKFFNAFLPLTDRLVFVTSGTFLWSGKSKFISLRARLAEYGITQIIEKDAKKEFNVDIDRPAVVTFLQRGVGSVFDLHTLDGKIHHLSMTREPLNIIDDKVLGICKKVRSLWKTNLSAERGRTTQLTKSGSQGENGKGVVSTTSNTTFKYKTLNRVSDPDSPRNPQWIWSDTYVNDCCSQYRLVYGTLSTNRGIGPIHLLLPNEQITQLAMYLPLRKESYYRGMSSWLKSNLFTVLLNAFRVNTANSLGVIRSLPTPIDECDLIRSWTDKDLYKHFNLSQEEINYIELATQ